MYIIGPEFSVLVVVLSLYESYNLVSDWKCNQMTGKNVQYLND